MIREKVLIQNQSIVQLSLRNHHLKFMKELTKLAN